MSQPESSEQILRRAKYRKTLIVTVGMTFLHRWPEAPEEVWYLRNAHRHTGTVTIEIEVTKDREYEFHMVQEQLLQAIGDEYDEIEGFVGVYNLGTNSMETLAERLIARIEDGFPLVAIECWEDDDCGVRIERR